MGSESITGTAPTATSQLYDIGANWRRAFEGIREFTNAPLSSPLNVLNLHYFGNVALHHSVAVESALAPKKLKALKPANLQPLARLIGDFHAVFRDRLLDEVNVHLDEERLDEQTLTAIGNFDKAGSHWRQAVLSTREKADGKLQKGSFPEHTKISDEEQDRIEAEVRKETDFLESSRLATLAHGNNPDIPIRIGGTRRAVPSETGVRYVIEGGEKADIRNADNIGLFLLGLPRVRPHAADDNKLSSEMQSFMVTYTGNAESILKNMKDKFAGFPALSDRYEAACAKCYEYILQLIRVPENTHALQMAALLLPYTHAEVCRELLQKAGQQSFPAELKTPEECAIVLNAILSSRIREDRAEGTGITTDWQNNPAFQALSRQCVAAAENNGSVDAATMKRVAAKAFATIPVTDSLQGDRDSNPASVLPYQQEQQPYAQKMASANRIQTEKQIELIKRYLGMEQHVGSAASSRMGSQRE